MIRFDDILERVSSSYSEKNITLLKKAYVFAAKAHQGQTRRSGEPYMSHPLEVTKMLAEMKLDHTTLAAGLLHDVLEDTSVSPLEIQESFGKEIADLVEGVTKISRMESSSAETRQAESIRKIILAMTDDLRIIFIKLADRVHNLKTLKFLPEEKQSQVAQETLDVYAPIANRLGMGRIKAELEDLSFRYVDPEGYFKMASLLEPLRKTAEKEIKAMKRRLEELMKENHIPADVFYRIKRPYSIYDKMQRQNINFDQVFDLMALRLITNSVRDCYSALGMIHQKWPHFPHRFRDFISMPKPNLYQALHTTIITEKKQTYEIQIRTNTMHNLAVNGIAAHWKYKEPDLQTLTKEDARLRWLREMVELYKDQKSPREFLKNLKTDLIPEEVYVFTPKGKVISLPIGATALDFAFKIHTEIGFHAQGAKINGRSAPLKTMVKTGDRVEILTLPEKKPSRDWLNMVFTSTARHHIKRWLNQQDRIKSTALGKKLWEKEVKKYKLSPPMLKKRSFLLSLSRTTHFRIKSLDDFFFLVGSGKIIPDRKFMEKLFPDEEIAQRKDTLLKKVVKKVKKRPEAAIQVVDSEGSFVRLAKCCSPIKGEPITGYITSGKGITAHSLRCSLVRNEILDSQRMVDISWEDSSEGTYMGRILIKGKDIPGLLADLTSAIAALKGNITKAEVNTFADRNARIRLSLEIRDIKHFNQIMNKISAVRGVDQAERI